ncbi:uncharacterized protein LOC134748705 [Cydia strobilella]|uniref:uncharacterized protein LOC134748705 n=1 Tax=Cydia strobilella TaxID=1100964 RepID=UPI003005ABDB
MLFLVFFITAFVAVISDDLVGVSYYFDEHYSDVYSDRQCVNTTRWSLVSYEYLKLVPPYEGRSKAIRALRNSCTATFPISFLEGTLEVTVYLRTISQYSGITVSVFDDRDEVITSVRYQRLNMNFVQGWVDVTVPIKEHIIGYVQISGRSLPSELVIVDSLRYMPGNLTYSQSDIKDQRVTRLTSDVIRNTPYTNMQDLSSPDEFIFAFNEIDTDGDTDKIDGSGDPPGPGDNTEGPDVGTEDPGIDSGTEEPEEDRENSEDSSFWNAFTITIVSVGAFTVVGVVGVGAYYIGKSKSVSPNLLLDLETQETPSIIPRARSVFSDVPYDRYNSFRRYS